MMLKIQMKSKPKAMTANTIAPVAQRRSLVKLAINSPRKTGSAMAQVLMYKPLQARDRAVSCVCWQRGLISPSCRNWLTPPPVVNSFPPGKSL